MGNYLCSEGFSFDSVSREYSYEDDYDYQKFDYENEDYDYKERVTDFKDNDDYVELSLDNIDIITKINDRKLNANSKNKAQDGLVTTPNYYNKMDNKLDEKKKAAVEDKVKLFFKELETDQESEKNRMDISQNVNRDKIMLIIGRVVELCLILLIIVTTILCVILLCAIKFC